MRFIVPFFFIFILSGCDATVVGASQSHDQPDSAPMIESDVADAADAVVTDDAVPALDVQPVADAAMPDSSPSEDAAPVADAVPVETDVTDAPRISGTLTIEPDVRRARSIIVAGDDIWRNMVQYRACATKERVRIELVNIQTRGEAASYRDVAVASDGRLHGSARVPSGSGRSVDVDVCDDPIMVPADGCVSLQLWARFAPVVASATVGGRWDGVARSGAQVALGLNTGNPTGEWGSYYADAYTVRATGLVSFARLYAAHRGPYFGQIFVVRKSVLGITHVPLLSESFANGADTDLVRIRLAADFAGPVAVKRISFFIRLGRASGSTMVLSGLRLRRGTADVSPSEYRMVDEDGRDFAMWGIGVRQTLVFVTLVFTDEEIVTGPGNVYTIHGIANGAVTGDQISIFPAVSRDHGVRTGYLTDDNTSVSESGRLNPGPHLDTGERPGMTDAVIPTTILWSDMSEVPHSALPGWSIRPDRRGGSRDWTDALGLIDFGWVQHLRR